MTRPMIFSAGSPPRPAPIVSGSPVAPVADEPTDPTGSPSPVGSGDTPSERTILPVSDNTFDLGTFTQVPLSIIARNAAGDTVPGVTPVWTSDDESIVTIKDNSDGTVTAVRVITTAGSVTIRASVTNADGSSAEGTLTLTLADQGTGTDTIVTDVEIVPGEPS